MLQGFEEELQRTKILNKEQEATYTELQIVYKYAYLGFLTTIHLPFFVNTPL